MLKRTTEQITFYCPKQIDEKCSFDIAREDKVNFLLTDNYRKQLWLQNQTKTILQFYYGKYSFLAKKKKGHLLVQSRKRHFLQISELFQAIKGRDGAVCFQSVTSALLFYPQFKRS